VSAARSDLPEPVRALALRCGARSDQTPAAVVLSQVGFMKDDPDDHPMVFSADETIQIGSTEFRWEARCDPVNLLVVRDQLIGEQGKLSLLAFGALPIASVAKGEHATKSEIMRYLAELPWAPDAILRNAELEWRVVDPRTFVVSAGKGRTRGSVTLRLDEQGFVRAIEAEDRPRKEGGGFVERPWRGRFAAYEQHDGRMVPSRGEMGWVIDGEAIDCWFGELRDWKLQ
jgi:hypothetical protein